MFRLVPVVLLVVLTVPLAAPVDALAGPPPDGVTALILPSYALAPTVVVKDTHGDYVFEIEIYQKIEGVWTTVPMQATLRAFVLTPTGEEDRVSVPFASRTDGPVRVAFPADAVGPAPRVFDLFITFSALGTPEGTPTSHHSWVKHLFLVQGDYDGADNWDYHNARVLGL